MKNDLWIEAFKKRRYPQKFGFSKSYPCLQDSRNREQPTTVAGQQVIDLGWEIGVVHRSTARLLLPTTFYKKKKEEVRWKDKKTGEGNDRRLQMVVKAWKVFVSAGRGIISAPCKPVKIPFHAGRKTPAEQAAIGKLCTGNYQHLCAIDVSTWSHWDRCSKKFNTTASVDGECLHRHSN